MPNGRCRLHGGKSPGAPKGNTNALKHGRYSAERIEARRKIATLLRTMRTVVRLLDKLMLCEEPKLAAITVVGDQNGHGTSCRPGAARDRQARREADQQ
jgi:hypothetical protein